MSSKKSISINAILNMIKTLMGVVFPLITYPYVARVLGPEYLGKVNYAQSIVSYFALIAALGVSTYAVREGAKIRSNKDKLQEFVNEIFTVNLVTTFASYIILFLVVTIVPQFHNYKSLILLLSLSFIFTTIGIDWINVLFEDYFIITIRSIAVQILNLALLFLFVKSQTDYYIYAFLTVFSNIVIAIWNFIYCRRHLNVHPTIHCRIIKHIKPLLVFFANNLAITIYCNSDSTMIGWIVGDACVGIYGAAVKVYSIIKTLLASVYTVCIPRLTNYYAEKRLEDFSRLINSIISGLILFLIPAMMGLIVLAKPIIYFLGGTSYEGAVLTLQILSISLLFAIIGGVFTNCINIPTGKEKLSLKATIFAAVINIGLNIIFIPLWKQNGAAITTVLAELTVLIVCFLGNKEIKKILQWKNVCVNMLHASIECFIIIGASAIIKRVTLNMLIQCALIVVISVCIYISLLLILKNNMALSIIAYIKMRVPKKEKNNR